MHDQFWMCGKRYSSMRQNSQYVTVKCYEREDHLYTTYCRGRGQGHNYSF